MLQNPTSSVYAATREREIGEWKGEKGRKEEKRTEEERRRRKKRRGKIFFLFKWVKKLNRDMEKQKLGKMENKGKKNEYKDSIIRKSGTI